MAKQRLKTNQLHHLALRCGVGVDKYSPDGGAATWRVLANPEGCYFSSAYLYSGTMRECYAFLQGLDHMRMRCEK